MGYSVRSVLALQHDDYHRIFLYFIPSHGRLKYDWINAWVDSRFDALVRHLAPLAVLIRPAYGFDSDYLSSIQVGADGVPGIPDDTAEFLHSGYPFLLLTETPLAGAGWTADDWGAAVNLAAFGGEDALTAFFDELLLRLRTGSSLVEAIPDLPSDLREEYNQTGGWSFAFEEGLELKPNVFGVGINLNAIAERFRQRRSRRRHRLK